MNTNMNALHNVFLLLAVFIIVNSAVADSEETNKPRNVYDLLQNVTVSRNSHKLSLQESLQALILQLRNEGSLKVPGFEIPDPKNMDYLNLTTSVNVFDVNLQIWNASVQGLSQIRLNEVTASLRDMNFGISLNLTELVISGQYKLKASTSFYFKINGEGNFWIKAHNIFATGILDLGVNDVGYLEIANISLDTTVSGLEFNFQNLQSTHQILRLLRTTIFNMIKPSILGEIERILRSNLDGQFCKLSAQPKYANSQVPIDLVIANTATQLREKKKDPLTLRSIQKGFNTRILFMRVHGNINLYDGYLSGLSSIHRTGDVRLFYKNNYANATLHIGFKNLEGSYKWKFNFMKISKNGDIHFTVKQIHTLVTIIQLNKKDSHPIVDDLKITNIEQLKAEMNGLGSLDTLLEFFTNMFANTFKKRLSLIVENNVKRILQKNLNARFFKFPF